MLGPGSWWDDDPELARLRFDSALRVATSAQPGSEARPPAPRALTFVTRRLTIEVEVHPDGLHGRLLPPQRATVAVLLADGRACDGQVNDAGRFSIAVVPAGMVRLRAVPESGLPVITEDIVL